MLPLHIRLHRNPWPETIGHHELFGILTNVARKRAEHVTKQFAVQEYKRECLGLVIMDPTAPNWLPSKQAVFCTIAIGEGGHQFVPNALAKAIFHRDHGVPGGYGVYMDPVMLANGDFCYGFSTKVDNTIAAASAQSEIQDACEAGHAAVSFNYYIRQLNQAWRESHPGHKWFLDQNEPTGDVSELAVLQVPRILMDRVIPGEG